MCQILGPWESPANLCPYFGAVGGHKACNLLFALYRALAAKPNRFVLENLNVKSLQQC